jgi:hypothetical protein
MAFPNFGIIDDTTRADENPLVNGTVWVPTASNMTLTSNSIVADTNTFGLCLTAAATSSADCELRFTLHAVPTVGNSMRWYLRGNADLSTTYYIQVTYSGGQFDDVALYKSISGVETFIDSSGSGVGITIDDVFGVDVVANRVTVYKNSSSIFTTLDSAIAGAGRVAILVSDNATQLRTIGAGPFAGTTSYTLACAGGTEGTTGGAVTPTYSAIGNYGLLDDFTRVNETPLTVGGNWARWDPSGNPGFLNLASNHLVNSAAAVQSLYYWTASFSGHTKSEIQLVGAPATGDVIVLGLNLTNPDVAAYSGYVAFLQKLASTGACNAGIYRLDAGVGTLLGSDQSAAAFMASSDTMGLEYDPVLGHIMLNLRTASILTFPDATYTSGFQGIGSNGTSLLLDNFNGGTLNAATTAYSLSLGAGTETTAGGDVQPVYSATVAYSLACAGGTEVTVGAVVTMEDDVPATAGTETTIGGDAQFTYTQVGLTAYSLVLGGGTETTVGGAVTGTLTGATIAYALACDGGTETTVGGAAAFTAVAVVAYSLVCSGGAEVTVGAHVTPRTVLNGVPGGGSGGAQVQTYYYQTP